MFFLSNDIEFQFLNHSFRSSLLATFNLQLATLKPKYDKYEDAPIHIVYSSNQDQQNPTGLNNGLTEEKVLESFALKKTV